MGTLAVTLGRQAANTAAPEVHTNASPLRFLWWNGALATCTGSDVISQILKFLISGGGNADNYDATVGLGTNYDAHEAGVGKSIAQARINIPAFEAIKAQYDWDASLLYGQFFSPSPKLPDNPITAAAHGGGKSHRHHGVNGFIRDAAAMFGATAAAAGGSPRVPPPPSGPPPDFLTRQTLEKELCRPVGCYLTVDNGGKITLIRPKNPMKFHVSKANNSLSVKVPTTSTVYTATLTVGVYNPTEMAAHVQAQLNASADPGATDPWTVTYSTTTNKFTVTNGTNSWDLTTSNGWKTLGFTSNVTNTLAGAGAVSDTAVGTAPTVTITENEMWDIRVIPNRDMQITSVIYLYDYDFRVDQFLSQSEIILAEDINIGGLLGSQTLRIEAKGLHSSEATYNNSPLCHWKFNAGDPCNPTRQTTPAGSGVDYNSMTSLLSCMALDRYHQPPLLFECSIPYWYNTLEQGDNLLVNYQIPDVFVDRELNARVLTNRVFEVLAKTDDPANGNCRVKLLGHRSSTTPSVSLLSTASLPATARPQG